MFNLEKKKVFFAVKKQFVQFIGKIKKTKPRLENRSSSVLAVRPSAVIERSSTTEPRLGFARSFDAVRDPPLPVPPRSSKCVQNEAECCCTETGTAGCGGKRSIMGGQPVVGDDTRPKASSCWCWPSWEWRSGCWPEENWRLLLAELPTAADCCWFRFNFLRSSWSRPVSLFNSSAGSWLASRRSSSAWIWLPLLAVMAADEVVGAAPKRWSSSVRRSGKDKARCCNFFYVLFIKINNLWPY